MSLLTLKWLAGFCLVLIIGCGDAGPEKTIVTVYSPHGKPILPEFEKLFETAHPTMDVQWLDMGSQDVLIDRVMSLVFPNP